MSSSGCLLYIVEEMSNKISYESSREEMRCYNNQRAMSVQGVGIKDEEKGMVHLLMMMMSYFLNGLIPWYCTTSQQTHPPNIPGLSGLLPPTGVE